MESVNFEGMPKIKRWSREISISEKIDGTSGCVMIDDDGVMHVGSRTRWITPEHDNMGFARWCFEHHDELLLLGHGRHFGEWWGAGIQRRYGQKEKIFSLFNSSRWTDDVRPSCCRVVPVLYTGPMDQYAIQGCLYRLKFEGSMAAPGYMNPEGIVIYHTAAGIAFKKTLEGDEVPKGGTRDADGNVVC